MEPDGVRNAEVFDCNFNQMLRMQQRAEGKPFYQKALSLKS
jgi:hypothetical protein